MEIRYSNHPDDSKKYTTEELRKHYLVEEIFSGDKINLTYSHVDRIIFGGAMPIDKELVFEADKEMAAEYFLERREMGIINIGGDGVITLDGVEYEMKRRDGIYIGRGTKEISLKS